ncbi:MAG: tetratricopeptide repeat protein [Acidobacteriota bacterium]
MKATRLAALLGIASVALLAACPAPESKPPRGGRSNKTKDAREPEDPRTYQRLGDSASANKQWPEAIDSYQKYLAIDPGNSVVHNSIGLANLVLGRADEAETHFRRAVEINPQFADALNNLGLVLDRKGDRAGAKTQFAACAAITTNITPWTCLYNLGKLQFEDGEYPQAVESFRQAFERRPEVTTGLGLGMALEKQGRLREACAQFEKCVKAFAADCTPQYYLGKCLYDQKRYQEAGTPFEKVVELCPGTETAGKANEYLKVLREH